MSATLTYPGVYIEELSSGQHTITGVATSIAAFIGWAPMGPTTEAVMVESFPEFQSIYGSFVPGIYLAYAVNHFFQNGGQQAYIIRLVASAADTPTAAQLAAPAHVAWPAGGATLAASNPGKWGNGLVVTVTTQASNPARFSLLVQLPNSSGILTTIESYNNLSCTSTDPQYVVTEINGNSNYIQFTNPGSPNPPTPATPTGTTTVIPFQGALLTGSVTSTAPFTSGETVKQTSSGATATLIQLLGSPPVTMILGAFTGAVDGGTAWTGVSSGAVFTSTAIQGPVVVTGADGDQLIPGVSTTQNFELALQSANGHFGYNLLSTVPIFNLLCVPGESDVPTIEALQTFCATYRAFLIVDAPQNVKLNDMTTTYSAPVGTTSGGGTAALPGSGPADSNSAYYYPWVLAPDPAFGGQAALFPPCGFVAGVYAATDANRGVWKAPAGINTSLSQVLGLQSNLTDMQNGQLNPLGINCLRQFRNTGDVVWGARTIAGADVLGSQWKYVPIRRLALFIESSLYDGTQWVVFEPNDETLWGQIRLNVGTFMQGLFLQGAFDGTTPAQAYFVKCDSENNPEASVALGIVNILVGFQPLYPAEFVVIQIQQIIDQS